MNLAMPSGLEIGLIVVLPFLFKSSPCEEELAHSSNLLILLILEMEENIFYQHKR